MPRGKSEGDRKLRGPRAICSLRQGSRAHSIQTYRIRLSHKPFLSDSDQHIGISQLISHETDNRRPTVCECESEIEREEGREKGEIREME